jgi:hypothetical protein
LSTALIGKEEVEEEVEEEGEDGTLDLSLELRQYGCHFRYVTL